MLGLVKLCESPPAVTRLTVYRRPQVRNEIENMARRTCFKEQYYTDARRYISVWEDCRQYQAETMCIFVIVYHQYLKIGQFVWLLVLRGTRYYQFASVDCSGVI